MLDAFYRIEEPRIYYQSRFKKNFTELNQSLKLTLDIINKDPLEDKDQVFVTTKMVIQILNSDLFPSLRSLNLGTLIEPKIDEIVRQNNIPAMEDVFALLRKIQNNLLKISNYLTIYKI